MNASVSEPLFNNMFEKLYYCKTEIDFIKVVDIILT